MSLKAIVRNLDISFFNVKSLNNFHSVKGALLDFRFLKILSFWILYEKLIEWESKIKAENLLYLEIVVIPENT